MLKVENLSVTYKKTGQKVLDGVSFSVKKGEVVAIMGPSGSGKTTLLNYIQKTLSKEDISSSGSLNMPEGTTIRMVFQESRLLPWKNVLENVSFGLESLGQTKSVSQSQARHFLKMVGLKKYENYYPAQLSVGMQQRVNLARALACRPQLLLMDEPFSALDEDTKHGIMKDFREIIIKNKITTIFVTHNPSEAEILADKSFTIAGDFFVKREYKNTRSFNIDSYDYFWGAE